MPTAAQKLTHCILLIAALLSPLQALQGTHLLCWLMGDCRVSTQTDAGIEQAEVACGCGHCNALVDSRNEVVATVPNQSPCDCPVDCFCRRVAQPLITPVVEELVQPCCAVADFTDTTMFDKDALRTPDVQRVDAHAFRSALAHCVALCRFTV